MATSETKHDQRLRRKRGSNATPQLVTFRASELAPRIAIERVQPELDGGRFAVKRAVGDVLSVEADIFGDGHDKIGAALLCRLEKESDWQEVPMHPLTNDRWRGVFPLLENARYLYTIIAWKDLFASWRDEVANKQAAGQSLSLELIEGVKLLERTITDGGPTAKTVPSRLADLAERVAKAESDALRLGLLMSEDTRELMARSGCGPIFRAMPRSSTSGSIGAAPCLAPGTNCSRALSPAMRTGTELSTMLFGAYPT